MGKITVAPKPFLSNTIYHSHKRGSFLPKHDSEKTDQGKPNCWGFRNIQYDDLCDKAKQKQFQHNFILSDCKH